MNNTALTQNVQPAMSSLDLLDLVNQAREQNSEPVLRRNVFHARVADELEGEHYKKIVVTNANGTQSAAFELSHDQCLLVSMRESKAVRRSVLEKLKAMEAPALPNFNDPVAAARAWADAKESEQRALAQAEAAKPALEFMGRYVEAGTTKSIRETAKILGLPEKAFIQAMIDDKILFRQSGNLLPHQKHHVAERFEVKTGERNGHAYTQSRVTSAGIDYLARVYGHWIGEVAA